MHRVLGDMLRVQLVKYHEKDDPIKDLTSSAAYAMQATGLQFMELLSIHPHNLSLPRI
mgnify:CR=1 FL=1